MDAIPRRWVNLETRKKQRGDMRAFVNTFNRGSNKSEILVNSSILHGRSSYQELMSAQYASIIFVNTGNMP